MMLLCAFLLGCSSYLCFYILRHNPTVRISAIAIANVLLTCLLGFIVVTAWVGGGVLSFRRDQDLLDRVLVYTSAELPNGRQFLLMSDCDDSGMPVLEVFCAKGFSVEERAQGRTEITLSDVDKLSIGGVLFSTIGEQDVSMKHLDQFSLSIPGSSVMFVDGELTSLATDSHESSYASSKPADTSESLEPGNIVMESHLVREGENLRRISMLWLVSEEEIKKANALTSDVVKPGQVLAIPIGQ
jgi:hypothetical protein